MTADERTQPKDLTKRQKLDKQFYICGFEGTVITLYSSLAQSVEHAAVNRSVVGSSPTGGVFSYKAPWSSG